jgi:hypothetical protein
MKLMEVVEDVFDEKSHEGPSRPPNMEVLNRQIQKKIDATFKANEEVRNTLQSATGKLEGPNVALTIVDKSGKTHAGIMPVQYLKKYWDNPKIFGDILLKRGMA